MARSLRIQYPGAFYHIACRGNERKKIFLDDDDRYRFLVNLEESLQVYQVKLYSYILMHNHFHLLLQTARANLSEFMRRFNICYTSWFNYRHERCGHLYQGRYKAFLIDADNYLVEVSRYLHLNNVRQEKLHSLGWERQWHYARSNKWSSLSGYLNKKNMIAFVDYDFILEMIGGRRAYQKFMLDGLKSDIENPFKNAQHGIILGDSDFVALVKSKHVEGGSVREQISYRNLVTSVVNPATVLQCIVNSCRINAALLTKREKEGVIRGIAAEMLYKYCNLTQSQIGQLLGKIDYGAVYQLRTRLKKKMIRDKRTRQKFQFIENILRQMLNVEI
jgi:putative transposase